jgi:hypothetical protein
MHIRLNYLGDARPEDDPISVEVNGLKFVEEHNVNMLQKQLADVRKPYADKIMKLEKEKDELNVMNAELNESHNELISDYRKKLNHIEVLQGNVSLLERNLQRSRERISSLELVKEPQLNEAEWEALTKAEKPLYVPFMGVHAYTDVMDRQDGQLAAHIWGQVEMSIEMSHENWDTYTSVRQQQLIAQRVARVLGVISFGSEFLLK